MYFYFRQTTLLCFHPMEIINPYPNPILSRIPKPTIYLFQFLIECL